jgi:molybdate transport system substrate-binding protein
MCQKASLMIAATRRGLAALVFSLVIAAVALPRPGFAGEAAAQPAVPAGAGKGPVVFAAASMKTALDAVAADWKANSGKTLSIVYASSAVLAKQIEQGAPADIFISADLQWMDYLEPS